MTRLTTVTSLEIWSFLGDEIEVELRADVALEGSEPRMRNKPWADHYSATVTKVQVRRYGQTEWHTFPLEVIPQAIIQRIEDDQVSELECAS